MKRRNRDTNTEPPIRTSFPAALHRVHSATTRPDSRSNRADGPKTSEYAFFKKLKKDAGQKYDSHSMRREKNQSNKLNSTEHREVVEGTNIVRNISRSSEGTNIITTRSKDFRSPLSVRNVSSKELRSLLSSQHVSSKDSGSSLPVNNVTCVNFDSFLSPVDGAANDWGMEGSQSDQVELFSKKRQKLHQWAHNSSPEMEELCSKGRLLPQNNEKNSFRSADSAPAENDTKTQLLACPKSDIPSKKLYRMPTRNIMEVEYLPYLENDTSSYWSDRSRDTRSSNICTPAFNNHNTIRKNLDLPSCELRGKNLFSCIEGDSTFSFPFVRHGSFPPFSPFKELDDFHDPNGSLLGREPFLLLEWDSINMNERSLSATCQNTNWTIVPAVQSSWDQHQSLTMLSESYGTFRFCSSSVLRNYPQDFYTEVPPTSTSCDKQELGGSVLEEKEETVADLNPLPLTLSHSSKYLNLIGDCNYYEIACKGSETSDILPSLGNHLGFLKKAFGEEDSIPGSGTHLSFALDVEWKCLQSSGLVRDRCSSTYNDHQIPEKEIIYSTFLSEDEFGSSWDGSSFRSRIHSSEDMLGIHDRRSFIFQISRDKDKAYPFLLDKSSLEDCTEEAYACGNEVKCL
ncbi:uncharacterized protein LOC110414426 isoform X2 [Herrania umbratica]|uniref:Uncharacterized protein LOC110414426 isoform X2 n=1 Tax=Herrania umbratica TaxID=108875 RepID=A0A6J1A3N2_9ROSI|nr:uncharacterized protein LOC110414426 isoform X2 [Herrania umbratica]